MKRSTSNTTLPLLACALFLLLPSLCHGFSFLPTMLRRAPRKFIRRAVAAYRDPTLVSRTLSTTTTVPQQPRPTIPVQRQRPQLSEPLRQRQRPHEHPQRLMQQQQQRRQKSATAASRPRPSTLSDTYDDDDSLAEQLNNGAIYMDTDDDPTASSRSPPAPPAKEETPQKVATKPTTPINAQVDAIIHYLAPESHLHDHPVAYKTAQNYDSVDAFLEAEQISSRPSNNWDPSDPLRWCANFGSRSPTYDTFLHENVGVKLGPGQDGYFDVTNITAPGVSLCRTKEQARVVLERLYAANPRIYHACDTEVMDIDLKTVGPIGNGYVTCVTMYAGPDFDYGLGDGPGTALLIDNLDDAYGVLQEFKAWFEDHRFLKVWHNYGFDRHVLWNEGINVLGFGGDTMHMARLLDSSRKLSGKGGYTLESLTEDFIGRKKESMKTLFGVPRKRSDGSDGLVVDIPPVEVMQRDPQHRIKFLQYAGYDAKGTWMLRNKLEEKLREIQWIGEEHLFHYYWMHMRPFGEVLTDMERKGIRVDDTSYLAKVEQTAKEDREQHRKRFHDWAAAQIGPDGLALNTASSVQMATFLFGGAINKKTEEQLPTVRNFLVLRKELSEAALEAFRIRDEAKQAEADKSGGNKDKIPFVVDGHEIDIDKMKVAELKQVLKEKGLKISGKKSELQERIKEHLKSEAKKSLNLIEPGSEFDSMTVPQLRAALIGRGMSTKRQKKEGTKIEMIQWLKEDIKAAVDIQETAQKENPTNAEMRDAMLKAIDSFSQSSDALKQISEEQRIKAATPSTKVDVTITSLELTPEIYTKGGAPSCTAEVLKRLAGDPFADPPVYGSAFDKLGKEGCEALSSLCAIGSIDTMIASFITTLQELADHQNRVHCSLNLNTETGRLSSRRPNLQNQPALEKDKYKIRKAFQSSPGNNLIVADYGQLELRLLASMTDCQSMIEAFKAGGDFHSRTAMDMFDYVKAKVDSGDVLLEWDYSQGDKPPKPMLKDEFASERRKAKTLNFSIAYGKTAHGLSKDWGVTTEEADAMLQAWYDARPEVRQWQKSVKECAHSYGYTRTLMGRYRQLPHGMDKKAHRMFGHAQRASINTPIQGGAADIAMMAMNKINNSPRLKQLGWILLLQIHDEVILEGPEETAAEAFEVVRICMEEPWVHGLNPTQVPLTIDGSHVHKSWYDAK